MKPPKFEYHAPGTLREALELLSEVGDDAVVLSGGQSLIPMLNLRLANPTHVIDLGGIDGLSEIEVHDDGLKVGAMTTHRQMETDPVVAKELPLAQAAARYIGYRSIRNRGTLGGSIAHADPAAEWPAIVLALDGVVHLASVSESRTVLGTDFFKSLFTTTKRPDELITSVQFSGRYSDAWGFAEFQRRSGDFATVAVAVACVIENGCVTDARISLAGVAERPVRCTEAEAALVAGSDTPIYDAASAARDAVDPVSDSHGTSEFRKRLVFAETQRAVAQALGMDLASVANA